jgi:hypothetical protein
MERALAQHREYRRSGREALKDVPAQSPGDEQASNQALGCGTDNDSARLGPDLEPSRYIAKNIKNYESRAQSVRAQS